MAILKKTDLNYIYIYMMLSLEHILILALVVCFCYYFMYNCSCKEGFRPYKLTQLTDKVDISDANPSDHCVKCDAVIATTLLTALGPDEIPVAGEGIMAFEFLGGLYQCGYCGLDVGEVVGCMVALKDDGQTKDARVCSCTHGKICAAGTPYRELDR